MRDKRRYIYKQGAIYYEIHAPISSKGYYRIFPPKLSALLDRPQKPHTELGNLDALVTHCLLATRTAVVEVRDTFHT